MFSLYKDLFEHLINTFGSNLHFFTFIATILEEVIGPIPAPVVLAGIGVLVKKTNNTPLLLLSLATVAATVKTLFSYILYVLSDASEDVIAKRFKHIFGLTHNDIESMGKRLSGGRSDVFSIFVFRAIPIFPSSPISIVCGIIKYPKKAFLTATFLGNLTKCVTFLLIGYTGIIHISKMKSLFYISGVVGTIIFVAFIIYKLKLRRGKSDADEGSTDS